MYLKMCWSYIGTCVSGSPIIQNGKIVGAVTHVLVNDPTRGYGIFSSQGTHRISEGSEQWFFYKPKDETYPFLCVTNVGVEQE